MSAAEQIKEAAGRRRKEFCLEVSALLEDEGQRALVLQIYDDHRSHLARYLLRKFLDDWSLEMVVSEMRSSVNYLEKLLEK